MSVSPPDVGPQVVGAGAPGAPLDNDIKDPGNSPVDAPGVSVTPAVSVAPTADAPVAKNFYVLNGSVYVNDEFVGNYGRIQTVSQKNGHLEVNQQPIF